MKMIEVRHVILHGLWNELFSQRKTNYCHLDQKTSP